MEVILEADRLNERDEAHEYLANSFHFPDHYGKNLDALYDLLTEISEPLTIRILYSDEEISEYGHKILDVLEDVSEECSNFIIETESI